jgi:outer membrane immunogenic protein
MLRWSVPLNAAVSAVLFAPIASAADLPVKAPVMKPVSVYDWTGVYVGGNIGYGWGRMSPDTVLNGVPIPSSAVNANGVIGGGQLGYNWQTGNLLLGVEGDLQWSGQTGHGVATMGFAVPPFGTLTVTQPYISSVDYFGTVRGRLGYAADRWLMYVTGGLAFGHDKFDVLNTALTATNLVGYSADRNGWTVGGGVEYALNKNWSAKVEYLHIDLGTWTVTNPLVFGTTIATTRVSDDIIRFGANYRFDAAAANMPADTRVYKAPPVTVPRTWTGIYAGVNAGGGWSQGAGGDLSGDSLPSGFQDCVKFGVCPPRIDVKYSGFAGGVQAGYNWQVNSLVLGVEADIDYANMDGSTTVPRLLPGPGVISLSLSQKVDAFATARGRVGFTPTDLTLLYVTGGFALGHTRTASADPSSNQPTFMGSDASWNSGWTGGGGIEQRLSKNLSAKAEALFYELNNSFGIANNASPFFGTSDTHYRGYILRAGLNYNFN